MFSFVPDLSFCLVFGSLVALGAALFWLKKRLAGGLCLLLAVAFLAACVLPDIDWGGRAFARGNCTANLRQIQGAKKAWAQENNKPATALAVEADLIGEGRYLRTKPQCPAGGSYVWGTVSQKPTCTLAAQGHTF